jgi:Catalase
MSSYETVTADEATRYEGYGKELAELQQKRVAKAGGTLQRALHLKAHTGAAGELVINAAPESARVGVFASPGQRFPVYVRFSNGSSSGQPDKAPDVRGFALKLVGVPGKKLILGLENAQTQDFLFINDPALPFRDPEEFMAFVRAAKDGPALMIPRLFSGVGFGRALSILKRALSSPKVLSFATHAFHTAAPLSLGTAAVKLGLFPLPAPSVPASSGDHYLRDDLVLRLKGGPLAWSLRAQLFSDEQSTPIEDASVVWPGPWVELATLTLPKQDLDSPKGKEISALVESFSFDPWHAIAEHRPLGAIMRARAVAYKFSVIARSAAAEPESVLSL